MFENKFKTFLIIIFIIILFICIGFTNGNNRKVTIVESILSGVITLPQKGYVYAKSWITKDTNFFKQTKTLEEENKKLKEENEELNAKLINYEVILSENSILKEHVNLTDSYPDYNVIVADIINESASNWEEVYIINRGAKDGVKPDMVVVAEDGLVGYIESVTDSTAKVISILDPGNTVSARITRTRDSLTCKGNSSLSNENKIRLTKIPTDLTLVEGDRIETSGLGGRYPKGIPIGEVIKFTVKKNPIENEAVVKTFVDFNKLETVAIIIEEYKSNENWGVILRNFWTGIIVFVVIILSVWLQLNIFNLIPFFGVKSNIGIILVVALSILCGQKIGITVGITYGFISDVIFGKTIGIYTFLFFLIGFFCGKISRGFSKENKSSIVMIVAISTLIFEILCYLLFSIVYKYDFELFSTVWIILLEAIYNVLVSTIVFKPLSFLSEIINKGKRSYYLL